MPIRFQILPLVSLILLVGCGLSPKSRDREPVLTIEQGEWRAGDGYPGTFLLWEGPGEPAAVWILIHGFGGAASDLESLAESVVTWGDSAYALDLRGMGPKVKGEQKGDVQSPWEWPTDFREFAALVSANHPGQPVYLVGESLGVSILVSGLASGLPDAVSVEGVVLLSPVVEFGLESTWFQRVMGQIFLTITPQRRIDLGDLEADLDSASDRPPMTPIPEEQARLKSAPHRLDSVTLRFLVSSIKLVNQTERFAGSLSGLPRFLAYGGKDAFIPAKRVEEFAEKLDSLEGSTEVVYYPEGHHLLLRDRMEEDLLEKIRAWRFAGGD